MSFLMIPEGICQNINLTATAKMVLSYVKHLSSKGKTFYGSLDYLSNELGIEKKIAYKSLQGLEQAGLIYKNSQGYFCDMTEEEIALWAPRYDEQLEDVARKLAERTRFDDGKSNISERDLEREVRGHGICEQ